MTALVEVSQVAAGVLDRCSLTVEPGTLCAVVGLAGSGRSTLAEVIMGTRAPEHGRVILDGVDVTDVSPIARARFGVGWVPRPPRPFGTLTVEENVVVAASATRRWGGQEAARRAKDLLDRYGMAHLARVQGWQLGPADAARLEVVRALAAPRRLIIVDELTASLPRSEVEELAAPICATAQMGGAVLWFGSPSTLAVIPDQLAVLSGGRVVQCGPPQEIENSPEWVSMVSRDASLPAGSASPGGFSPPVRSPSRGAAPPTSASAASGPGATAAAGATGDNTGGTGRTPGSAGSAGSPRAGGTRRAGRPRWWGGGH